MGFYIRKSIKAGPFRFNLSSSGIGVSAGIKGLRVGTGPRGNYIHIGYGGLYYRKTLNNQDIKAPKVMPVKHYPARPEDDFSVSQYTNVQEIESGDIGKMVDSSSTELLAEFDNKKKKWRTWPGITTLCILSCYAISNIAPEWGLLLAMAASMLAIYLSYNYDQIRKSVVLFYEMDNDFEDAYKKLHEAFSTLQESHKKWHVEMQADIIDRKRNAGASQAVRKKEIALKIDDAPYVKTNISIPSMPVGKQTLFFFPDRILVFENDHVGAIAYADLNIQANETRFIEEGSVPRDSQIVDHTWRYVNKTGGPDRRFNNNRQIPICLYEDMNLTSSNGLFERIQFSKCGNTTKFSIAANQLARVLDDATALSSKTKNKSLLRVVA